MCTVVFIPGNKKIFLGSLRDESPKRPRANVPEISRVNALEFLAPKDPMAGGTWVGVNNSGNAIALLNGGFNKHTRKDYYRKSRGLIVSDLLASPLPVIEWNLIDMQGIEPFTLIVWSDNNLFQLVWDGLEQHKILLDATRSYLWSSSTLYNAEARGYREELFQNWMAMNPPVSKLSLLNFFKSYNEAQNGFRMNRQEIIKTLSFSFIELIHNNQAVLDYYDFLTYSYSSKALLLQTELKDCILPADFKS